MDKEFKENRIRNRKSYMYFKGLMDFLSTNPSKEDILKEFHVAIDIRRGFRYRQQAHYAWESVEQVILDTKEVSNG
jgi:hypothetical protein